MDEDYHFQELPWDFKNKNYFKNSKISEESTEFIIIKKEDQPLKGP